MKKCNKCGVEKDESGFYLRRDKKKGTEDLCTVCKECMKDTSRRWKGKNKDRQRRYWEEWSRNHKEHLRERDRVYYIENRDYMLERNRKFHKKNPAYKPLKDAKYRAKKKNATPKWADEEEIKYIYSLSQEKGLEVDHIVPLTSDYVCGLHCADNLRAIPDKLNQFKRNRYWPDMWK